MDYIWNITGRCNLKCEYCWDIFKQTNELDTFKAKQIIDNLVESSCNMILFTGGEPLVRNDIFKLINYCKEKGLEHIKICSNGTLIKNRIEELKKSPISEIHISLDSYYDEEKYRFYNNKVIENIELLIKSIDINRVKVVLVSVIDHNNLDGFEKVLKYAKEKNIYVTYQLPVLDKNSSLELNLASLDKENLKYLFEKLKYFHEKYKSQLDYFSNYYYQIAKKYYILGETPNSCLAGKDFKVVAPNGEIYSCYSCKERIEQIDKCFNEKCLVWFRSSKRGRNIINLLKKI
ncbi:MAG: radical SAM protein [Sarcina sp.]